MNKSEFAFCDKCGREFLKTRRTIDPGDGKAYCGYCEYLLFNDRVFRIETLGDDSGFFIKNPTENISFQNEAKVQIQIRKWDSADTNPRKDISGQIMDTKDPYKS